MHLFYDIMLYQQFLYFSYQKAIPIYQFILPNLKNMPSVIRIRCRLMGSPRLAYFFANNAFRNFGTKTYCKLIATANRKKTFLFSQGVFVSIETFFPSLQRVQNGGIHVAGDNGTIQPIPFSFEPTGKNRLQQSKNC